MYVTRGMEGVIQNVYRCVQGERGTRFMCTYALILSLFMFLSYGVLFYLQKWLFFSNGINFCCNEISFFYFKLLFRTKVSQSGFNFNQIEPQVYSKFQCDTLLWENPVQRSTEIYLIGYFTSIFTDIVLYYCHCCCYCYLMLLLLQFLK